MAKKMVQILVSIMLVSMLVAEAGATPPRSTNIAIIWFMFVLSFVLMNVLWSVPLANLFVLGAQILQYRRLLHLQLLLTMVNLPPRKQLDVGTRITQNVTIWNMCVLMLVPVVVKSIATHASQFVVSLLHMLLISNLH
jgi:hypothetical protein